MKRPEGMPFYAYRMALKKLNERIDLHLRGRPLDADNTLTAVKPLALAVSRVFA